MHQQTAFPTRHFRQILHCLHINQLCLLRFLLRLVDRRISGTIYNRIYIIAAHIIFHCLLIRNIQLCDVRKKHLIQRRKSDFSQFVSQLPASSGNQYIRHNSQITHQKHTHHANRDDSNPSATKPYLPSEFSSR